MQENLLDATTFKTFLFDVKIKINGVEVWRSRYNQFQVCSMTIVLLQKI